MAQIDRDLDELPTALAELVLPLRGRVGRPGEYFLADDDRVPPVLAYHVWLLDDLEVSDTPRRAALEDALFASGWFRLAAIATQQMLLDGDRGIAQQHAVAIPLFQHLADARLASVLPVTAAAWDPIRAAVVGAANASARPKVWLQLEAAPRAGHLLAISGQRWAPMISLAVAVAHYAERDDLVPELLSLLHAANDVHSVRGELQNLRHDAERGLSSYPIERIRLEAGLGPEEQAERLLGALVATGCGTRLLAETRQRTERAGAAADRLDLPTFAGRLETLATSLGALEKMLEVGPMLASLASGSPSRTLARAGSHHDDAIARAEGFLLQDPEMREAWDVYRTGFLGEKTRTGRPFPVGFVLENMCASGLNLGAEVEAILDVYRENRGDYFDGPVRLPRDIDTLGLMLRLRSRVAGSPELDRLLHEPLHHVAADVREGGDLSVWVSQTAPPGAHQTLYGRSCAACQANLLLGLARQSELGFDDLLSGGAQRLALTLATRGSGAAAFYSPPYTVWIIRELVSALSEAAPSRGLASPAEALARGLDPLVVRMAPRVAPSPQTAALLLLAKDGRRADLIEAAASRQRPDGGWDAEPLYWAPTPEYPGYWYASRTATTSLCHRALLTARPAAA